MVQLYDPGIRPSMISGNIAIVRSCISCENESAIGRDLNVVRDIVSRAAVAFLPHESAVVGKNRAPHIAAIGILATLDLKIIVRLGATSHDKSTAALQLRDGMKGIVARPAETFLPAD